MVGWEGKTVGVFLISLRGTGVGKQAGREWDPQSDSGAVSGLLAPPQALVQLCDEFVRPRPSHELLPLHVPVQQGSLDMKRLHQFLDFCNPSHDLWAEVLCAAGPWKNGRTNREVSEPHDALKAHQG